MNSKRWNVNNSQLQRPETMKEYLKGAKISTGLQIKLPDQPYTTRIELLEKLSSAKKIIHVGFTDHKDIILTKIKGNVWLHKRLMDVSERCIGIDINCEAVEFVRNELGIGDIYCLDIMSDGLPHDLKNTKWDSIILGEVLEHIDNPVLFLKNLKDKVSSSVEKIILTVPNAFRYANFDFALKGKEVINSDHRYWFTPYTIMKILTMAEIEIENVYMVETYHNSENYEITAKNPILRDDIVISGKF